ncbi:hypothetical protein [Mycolicibacterium sp. CH28]|nr:hypothetical protein [Mycolicibacterium sp. CH28]
MVGHLWVLVGFLLSVVAVECLVQARDRRAHHPASPIPENGEAA